MKFVLNITGVQNAYILEDHHGGGPGDTIKWKVENKTLDDFTNVTFKEKTGHDFPFDPVTPIPRLAHGGKGEIKARIKKPLRLGPYKFNLVADPHETVIGADPDIEVALDLGLSKKRKKKRVVLTPGKSKQLKSRKPAVKKGKQKPAKPSKRKKTAKRK